MLPLALLDDDLGSLAVPNIRAEDLIADGLAVVPGQGELEGRAGVVVPYFDGVEDAVPVGLASLAFEEVVDVGAGSADVVGLRVPVGFDVVALFGVRSEVELLDDVLGRAGHDGWEGRQW